MQQPEIAKRNEYMRHGIHPEAWRLLSQRLGSCSITYWTAHRAQILATRFHPMARLLQSEASRFLSSLQKVIVDSKLNGKVRLKLLQLIMELLR